MAQLQKGQQIQTFVFLDLEATGLRISNPRITEISLLAVHRKTLLQEDTNDTPRVINKVTLCVKPTKRISNEASDLTGLNHDNLAHVRKFDEDLAALVGLFLKRLEPPITLVAHNGDEYDFPLLKRELDAVNGNLDVLDDLLCVDTLTMFRELDEEPPAKRFAPNQLRVFGAKRPSYKLPDLHARIVGYPPPTSHTAEDDAMALVRIFTKSGESALSWADGNAVLFSHTEPM